MHTAVIGKRDPQVFGLATGVGPHTHISICRAGGAWIINGQTDRRFTSAAIVTKPTGHVERQDHSVSLRYGAHSGTDFFDNAHIFVTESDTRFRIGAALIHVQIRTADSSRGDSDNHIAWCLDDRVFNVFYSNLVWYFIYNSFYQCFTPRLLNLVVCLPIYFEAASKA